MTDLRQRVEEQKAAVLARVGQLPEQRQKTPASARVWSPLQIVEHLMLVEKEYLGYLAAGESAGVSARRPTRHLMIPIMCWGMRRRISVPTLPSMEPSKTDRSLAELTAQWRDVRNAFLEKLDTAVGESPIALNPLFGPMNRTQILTIMTVHLDYHLAQIPEA